MSRPWGINTIGDLYRPGVQAGLPDGRWVVAVPEPTDIGRFRAAWWVLTGRAYAFLWPQSGDLEMIFSRLAPKRHTISGSDAADDDENST